MESNLIGCAACKETASRHKQNEMSQRDIARDNTDGAKEGNGKCGPVTWKAKNVDAIEGKAGVSRGEGSGCNRS